MRIYDRQYRLEVPARLSPRPAIFRANQSTHPTRVGHHSWGVLERPIFLILMEMPCEGRKDDRLIPYVEIRFQKLFKTRNCLTRLHRERTNSRWLKCLDLYRKVHTAENHRSSYQPNHHYSLYADSSCSLLSCFLYPGSKW